jgi:hypothetical protein
MQILTLTPFPYVTCKYGKLKAKKLNLELLSRHILYHVTQRKKNKEGIKFIGLTKKEYKVH